jgi:outer membrane protein, heavy metal efflux system
MTASAQDRSVYAWYACVATIAISGALALATAQAQDPRGSSDDRRSSSSSAAATRDAVRTPAAGHEGLLNSHASLTRLVAEALERNPEIKAAARERDAAAARVAPAGALDDPMLEAGIINLPFPETSLRREDMTMKMLGLSQRLPYPGKRGLREELADREAAITAAGYEETVNRIVRDTRIAYLDLALVLETVGIVQRNRMVLEQFLKTAEVRYAVGQATQSDVLKAQTQLSKMVEELIRLDRERSTMQSELERVVARPLQDGEITAGAPPVLDLDLDVPALRTRAERSRPQILGLRSAIERSEKAVALARSDYYPDFDVRFAFGQRDRMPDGARRENMVSLTVAINLPVWQSRKRDPRLAEAIAMRAQAIEMLRAQLNDLAAKIRQQAALAEQSAKSVRLYETGILPQARLSVEAALAAYRVNRVDFLTLLDSQMAVFNYEIGRAQAATAIHKALGEIELLVGEPNRRAAASDVRR